MKVNENRLYGSAFEKVLNKQSRLSGVFSDKNPLSCRHVGRGKIVVLKSELDFKLINHEGRVAYIDCKCFVTPYFTYSDLDKAQVKRAVHYNDWNVPSGFVVWFRETKEVVFYTGHAIQRGGPRHRFLPFEGVQLGVLERFDVRKVFTCHIW